MSQPMPVSRRLAVSCKRGFTLMELLVVIAIIAVLISFLLPALSQARRESNKAKCLSALKDLGSAFNIYATEFKQACLSSNTPTRARW
jgi:prepilin-type N-terminal cleavage/methylation domain-containing protein